MIKCKDENSLSEKKMTACKVYFSVQGVQDLFPNPTLVSLNPTLARDGRFYSSLSSYQIKEKAHYYLSLEPRDITDPNASFILVSNKIIRSHTTY